MKNASSILESVFITPSPEKPIAEAAKLLINFIESTDDLELVKRQLTTQASYKKVLLERFEKHVLLHQNSDFREKTIPVFPYKDELVKAKYAEKFLTELWPTT